MQLTVGTVLAEAARAGRCRKRKVGAVLLDGGEVEVTAANGVPFAMRPCEEGGCIRCASPLPHGHGMSYDLCACLHAEEALLVKCLELRVRPNDLIVATSYQPCIMCTKWLVATKVGGVRYLEPWAVPEVESGLQGLTQEYRELQALFPYGCTAVEPETPLDRLR